MTKADFELQASVQFMYAGWEFEISQSRASPDNTWYVWGYIVGDGFYNNLGSCPNPFTNYDECIKVVNKIVTKYIKAQEAKHES